MRAVQPLGGGSINGAFRVVTKAGKFHLRVYRSPDRARVQREHAAIALAISVSLPTPAPLPTLAGGTIAQLEGRLAALFLVAPGSPVPRPSLSSDHAAALGTFFAGVHERLPNEISFEVPELRAAPIEHTLERLELIQAAILALPAPDEVDGWALDRTHQRLAHLRASPLPDAPPAFPPRFLHGDYHEGNVFFTSTRRSTGSKRAWPPARGRSRAACPSA